MLKDKPAPYYSVITICFNDFSGLKATYESLISQDFFDFEWIVIDGGSADGTKEFLEHLVCSFSFQWVSERDKGIYNAMNKGLQMTSGRYLFFMNSNDRFHNSGVMSQVATVINDSLENVGIVYGDSIDLLEDGRKFYRPARNIGFLKFGMVAHHQSMVFSSRAVGTLLYNEEFKYSSDYQFIGEVVNACREQGAKIIKIETPVSSFSLGGAHQINRKIGMTEAYYIRKRVLGIPTIFSFGLYLVHNIHAAIKNRAGFVYSWYRYRKNYSG